MTKKIYNRFGRKYTGLDCSGKSQVLPPTFEGIRALVNKVGETAAYAAFPNPQEPENSTIEEDIVLDFVDDLNHASDKVERLTLLEEFSSYLDQVRDSLENPPAPEDPKALEGAQQPQGETPPQGGEA